jgi:hypothetical protein
MVHSLSMTLQHSDRSEFRHRPQLDDAVEASTGHLVALRHQCQYWVLMGLNLLYNPPFLQIQETNVFIQISVNYILVIRTKRYSSNLL